MCASARSHHHQHVQHTLSNDDVWLATTDGQMSQICILNTTLPDLLVSSCNTVASAAITCMKCVPPFRLRCASNRASKSSRPSTSLPSSSGSNAAASAGSNSADPTTNYHLEAHDLLNNSTSIAKTGGGGSSSTTPTAACNSSANTEAESLIDYESSDDEESAAAAAAAAAAADGDDAQQQQQQQQRGLGQREEKAASSAALLSAELSSLDIANILQDNKNSTMWIGAEDGR